jgi:serine/threonine protein kinase
MSPEQVRGLPVDLRSDVFLFGAISEMLTGRKAFKRDTPSDTMAAIMRRSARFRESGRNDLAGPEPRRRHCLEKGANRFQSARDIAFAVGGHFVDVHEPDEASSGESTMPSAVIANPP